MPRVRILAALAGEQRTSGQVVDLPAAEAQELIRQQRAELVREPLDYEIPESATDGPAGMERTVSATARRRTRTRPGGAPDGSPLTG